MIRQFLIHQPGNLKKKTTMPYGPHSKNSYIGTPLYQYVLICLYFIQFMYLLTKQSLESYSIILQFNLLKQYHILIMNFCLLVSNVVMYLLFPVNQYFISD